MITVNANGASIPALGFGTWKLLGDDAVRMVRHALAAGYRHIDTAQIYDNEAEVGEAIKTSGVPRQDVFLTTKVWVKNFKTANFIPSVEESLQKLKTDYVDLLLLHWPSPVIPLEEQMASLNAVKASGKARFIGVSNYPTALLAQASQLSPAPFVTNQIEFHPYLDQSKVVAATQAAGMCVTAYSPTAAQRVCNDPLLHEIGIVHGKSATQVALRWIVQQGHVVLSKSSSEVRASKNLEIFDFALTRDEMAAISSLATPEGRTINPDRLAPEWD